VRGYRLELFREDLKKLYEMTGINQQTTVFLFNDTQVIETGFLEDINGMLTSGEVAGLYAPDEKSQVTSTLPLALGLGLTLPLALGLGLTLSLTLTLTLTLTLRLPLSQP